MFSPSPALHAFPGALGRHRISMMFVARVVDPFVFALSVVGCSTPAFSLWRGVFDGRVFGLFLPLYKIN